MSRAMRKWVFGSMTSFSANDVVKLQRRYFNDVEKLTLFPGIFAAMFVNNVTAILLQVIIYLHKLLKLDT